MIIDAHQHFWDQASTQFNYAWTRNSPPLDQTYLPADLKPALAKAGVERTVFVQTQHNLEENRWVLKLADEHDFIAGVVGWVDLRGENCEEQLAEFTEHPKFVGVRHIVQSEPDEDWVICDDTIAGLELLQKHGVAYDLLFYTQHLRHAATLGRKLPQLKMVINHLSKPKIKLGPEHESFTTWKKDLAAAAEFPNVYCKLSGMITEADHKHWKPADLKPYVDHAIACFSFDRLMFGSDWPVCLLAGSYEQVVDALREVTADISDDERAKLWGETAQRFYGLKA